MTGKKKLTLQVLTALMFAGGQWCGSLPVVEAADETITADTTISEDRSEDTITMGSNSIALTIAEGGKVKKIVTGDGVGNNTITIKGLLTDNGYEGAVLGGATGMKVYVQDGAVINKNIYGGNGSGDVTGNTVEITGGSIGDGSETYGPNIYGGSSTSGGNVSNNTITISGDAVLDEHVMIYGGLSAGSGNVTDNTVNILKTISVLHIMGGDSYGGGTISGNTLNIAAKGVTVGGEGIGGFQNINFFLPAGITTSDTMVTVTGTSYLDGTKVAAAAQAGVNLNNGDKVTLLSGTINGTITPSTTVSSVPTSITTDATYAVTVSQEGTNKIVATVAKEDSGSGDSGSGSGSGSGGSGSSGSGSGSGSGSDSGSGGSGSSGSGSSGNSGSGNSGSGNSGSGNSGSGSGSGNSGSGNSGSGSGNSGSGSGNSGSGSGSGNSGSGSGNSGSGSSGSGNSSSGSGVLPERTKSLVETRAAATSMLNAGLDLTASQGFEQAAQAVALKAAEAARSGGEAPSVAGFTPYAAIGGSNLRAESGSHVDMKGWGINVGFARELPNADGTLLFGPFVEYGHGSYDSYLDNGIHGSGKTSNWGIGIMARQTNKDGFYYEGSLRGGKVTSDYSGALAAGLNADYDSSSNYYAAHLGLGKVFALNDKDALDGYLKYFYSHQAGDSVTVHATLGGDQVFDFDSVNSHRLRLGGRLTHKMDAKQALYAGLAYQYEFNGDARASYNGTAAPSPSLKGGSGMLELGWQVKAADNLDLDLGITGWTGKQRGFTAQLGANWKF